MRWRLVSFGLDAFVGEVERASCGLGLAARQADRGDGAGLIEETCLRTGVQGTVDSGWIIEVDSAQGVAACAPLADVQALQGAVLRSLHRVSFGIGALPRAVDGLPLQKGTSPEVGVP